MYKKILLPIDLNHRESWEKTFPLAVHYAGDSGEVHLLGIVHDIGAGVVSTFLPEGFERKAMEKLKSDLADFAEEHAPGNTQVKVHVGHGHVPEAILRSAAEYKADLIMMASHPPNELQTLLVGSYANKVVRNANISVLVVR